jgi:hypothetical protein
MRRARAAGSATGIEIVGQGATMRSALLALLAISFLTQAPSVVTREALYNRPEMPGVYLSYVRTDPRAPLSADESPTGVWLRLTNNLRVPILLFANSDLESVTGWQQTGADRNVSFFKNGSEVRACYDVEGVPQLISRVTDKAIEMEIPFREAVPEPSARASCLWYGRPHGEGRLISLAPGNTVIFSVPENFVTAGRRISTKYAFEWELDENGYRQSDEPAHFVYFRKAP